MAKFLGGCVCGAVRYECDSDPIVMFKCHCRDCQHVSGGVYSTVLLGFLAGSLDDPSLFRPTMDIQLADAQPWDLLDPDTQKFDRYPAAQRKA